MMIYLNVFNKKYWDLFIDGEWPGKKNFAVHAHNRYDTRPIKWIILKEKNTNVPISIPINQSYKLSTFTNLKCSDKTPI